MTDFSFTELDKGIRISLFCFVSSLVLPGVICELSKWYFGIDFADSIGRSGSVMVLLGVLTEYRVFKVRALYEERPIMDEESGARAGVCLMSINIIHFGALTIVCIGTLIWGYGDLIFGR